MKHLNQDNHKGCPNTEMRSRRSDFESSITEPLNLHMKPDAPHYSEKATRIAYSKWEAQQ